MLSVCRVLGSRAGIFQAHSSVGKDLRSAAQVFSSQVMTSSSQLHPSSSHPKPPNVLVYQSDKDPSSKEFLRVKESLELCLTPERYVIYPLGHDDIIGHAPWKDNCKLLILPPPPSPSPHATEHAHNSVTKTTTLSSRVIEEVLMFAYRGGPLLSMHPEVNTILGLRPVQDSVKENKQVLGSYCHDNVCSVEISDPGSEMEQAHRFSALLSNSGGAISDRSDSVYLNGQPLDTLVLSSADRAFLVPLEWNGGAAFPGQNNANQSNNKDHAHQSEDSSSNHLPRLPCVHEVTLAGSGTAAILSSVDLCPLLPEGLSLSPLLRLKGGVALRGRFLSELLGGLGLECSEETPPQLSHTYLLASEEDRTLFLSAMKPHLFDSSLPGNEVTLEFLTTDYALGTPVDDAPCPTPSRLTVVAKPASWQLQQLPFRPEEYFGRLVTRELGRTVLYTPVITSTQLPFTGNLTFAQSLERERGVVWVAAQQTKGKGRSGNAWISPRGSMMFSMVLPLSSDSRLAHHLPLLQHIVGVGVVHGVRSREGYHALPLTIKWPNDIYYQSRVKLGGILVSCLSLGNSSSHTAIIGCGVNVSNRHPTMSINDCIALYNREVGTNLPPLSVEEVLASTFNTLESLLSLYEVQGLQPFLQLYYLYWLHSDAEVSLGSSSAEKVRVVGLDKYGYLQVRQSTGETLSLQPDGNSFDIMKGLIVMKN